MAPLSTAVLLVEEALRRVGASWGVSGAVRLGPGRNADSKSLKWKKNTASFPFSIFTCPRDLRTRTQGLRPGWTGLVQRSLLQVKAFIRTCQASLGAQFHYLSESWSRSDGGCSPCPQEEAYDGLGTETCMGEATVNLPGMKTSL